MRQVLIITAALLLTFNGAFADVPGVGWAQLATYRSVLPLPLGSGPNNMPAGLAKPPLPPGMKVPRKAPGLGPKGPSKRSTAPGGNSPE